MNRRHFAKSVVGGLGMSMLATQTIKATTMQQTSHNFKAGQHMKSNDGLKMTLSNHKQPTKNQDSKQFILTFDVHNNSAPLVEKIYDLTDNHGIHHQIYMTPVANNQLQAVFNWRTHA